MEEEQYLTEKHYLVCDKGMAPKQMKVTSQNFTYMSGHLAATEKDTLKNNNFLCLGSVAFIAGAVAGVCCCIPGPGWLVAAIIAAAIAAAIAIGYFKCKAAATQRVWTKQSPVVEIQGKKALTLSSIMVCPAEGGTITPKETVWEAWGSAALTNLGHVANFAFGFLAGRGLGGMTMGATSAAGGMSALATRQGAATFGREFGKQFLNTARKELIEQFTFKGFTKASTFCKIMRGLGIGGAYYEQYNIWSSDQDTLDKLKESSVSLILSVFAAKGASLVCFPAGTKVHTSDGLANIEDLFEGNLVLTFNELTKEQEYKPILKKHERFTLQMLSIELPTGEFVRVTPEHRFYCNEEWIDARDLQPGDLLHLKGGHYTTVISVETLPHYEKVYNFDIEGNENYYVTEDGILVHNGYGTPKDPWEAIDDFRGHAGMPRLGETVPKIGDGNGTVAFVDLDGKKIFGINSSLLSDSSKDLGRKWKEILGLGRGKDQVFFHAEGNALMRTYERLGGNMPKEMTMYVDRYSCGNCQTYLPEMMKEMGIEKLTIFSKNGKTVILPK